MHSSLTALALLTASLQVFAQTTVESTTEESTTEESSSNESGVWDEFVAPTPATAVPTSANTTVFELTLVTLCSDCRSHFNADGHPSVAFQGAYETTIASNLNGVDADDVDAVLNLIKVAATRVSGDKINGVITIAQENMDTSTKQAISGATSETIMANTAALADVLPAGTQLSVESLRVDETSTSSSVQIGSALSFLCSLLWLIK